MLVVRNKKSRTQLHTRLGSVSTWSVLEHEAMVVMFRVDVVDVVDVIDEVDEYDKADMFNRKVVCLMSHGQQFLLLIVSRNLLWVWCRRV